MLACSEYVLHMQVKRNGSGKVITKPSRGSTVLKKSVSEASHKEPNVFFQHSCSAHLELSLACPISNKCPISLKHSSSAKS